MQGNLYSFGKHPMGHRKYLDGVHAQTRVARQGVPQRLRTAYH